MLYSLLRPAAPLPDHLAPLQRAMSLPRGPTTQSGQLDLQSSEDLNMTCHSSKLQELREKERAYKESYTLLDELLVCLRCLLD